MGKEAEPIFSTFTFVEKDNDDYYEAVIKKFDEHLMPKRNTLHKHAYFHRHSDQQQGESAEAFARHCYELAEDYDFGATKDEQIRDCIVI